MNEFVRDFMAVDPVVQVDCFVWFMSIDLEPQLGDIKISALIIVGAKDTIPVDLERRYANAISGCRFEVWKDNGQYLVQERPQEFVDLL